MINLSGDKDSSEKVRIELERVGVKVARANSPIGEPCSWFYGELNGFKFERSWRYYTVTGKMPIEVARELHKHPIAAADVRVVGHCGCPHPDDDHWASWYEIQSGKKVISCSDWVKCKDYASSPESSLKEIGREILKNCIPEDYPEKHHEYYKGFIESYDVDSEAGLLLLVQAIRKIEN